MIYPLSSNFISNRKSSSLEKFDVESMLFYLRGRAFGDIYYTEEQIKSLITTMEKILKKYVIEGRNYIFGQQVD